MRTRRLTTCRIRSFTIFTVNEGYRVKRIIAATLLICLLLSGCKATAGGAFFDRLTSDEGGSDLLTVKDSTSRLDIYPESANTVGKFDRMQFAELNELQKSIYIKIDNAAYDMKTGFIDVGECSYRDLELAYFSLRCDRPEYFWLPTTYTLSVVGEHRRIQLAEDGNDWVCSAAERREAERVIRELLAEFYGTVTEDMTEYDRELAAHDWLAEKISYDHRAIGDDGKLKTDQYPDSWSIKGALVGGTAVCVGYSKAVQTVMYMLGLQCGIVAGRTDEPHMWNIIKIDGMWHHLDLTSDDADDENTYYSYFNVTDELLLKGRTVYGDFDSVTDDMVETGDYNYQLPSCTSIRSYYFVKEGAYITEKSQIKSAVVSLVCAAVRSGEGSVEIGFSTDIGIDYETDDPDSFFELSKAVNAANDELPRGSKLKMYKWGYFKNGYSVKISW